MREIKFRAWHRKDGKWFYGTNGELKANDETTMRLSIFWHLVEVGELDADTVGQYTGLKDKNGKEIYEGDIFKIAEPPAEINSVVYDRGTWYLMEHGLHLTDECDIGEVIGNIYEHAELLGGGK